MNSYINRFIAVDKKRLTRSKAEPLDYTAGLIICLLFGVIAVCLLINDNFFVDIATSLSNTSNPFKGIIDFVVSLVRYLHPAEMMHQINELF